MFALGTDGGERRLGWFAPPRPCADLGREPIVAYDSFGALACNPLSHSGELRTPMAKPSSCLKKLLREEDGPPAVEYAVVLRLIMALSMAAVGTVGTTAAH